MREGINIYNINDITNTIVQGNVLDELKKIPDNTINMVITSPPYWGLRNYNTDPQIWDEEEGCDVWRGELGSEPTFNLYIKHLCDIFDEVKRVLTEDGTCWVNLGDTYAGGKTNDIVPNKSLCCIPDRFKIQMIDRGWICRNDIIWHKPNAMPSSVKDRFTVDYERLFFFTKNKKYYFEQQKEPVKDSYFGKRGSSKTRTKFQSAMCGDNKDTVTLYTERNKRSMWSINTQPLKEAHFAVFPEELVKTPVKAGCPENGIVMDIFMGSGTTAVVAKGLNRNYIGIELNPEYINIAKNRIFNL
ncbi:MAG TPA: site-specific DNA-methyltransferase [Clostridium sp.]